MTIIAILIGIALVFMSMARCRLSRHVAHRSQSYLFAMPAELRNLQRSPCPREPDLETGGTRLVLVHGGLHALLPKARQRRR